MGKLVNMDTALDLIKDESFVATSGFMLGVFPEEVLVKLGERFSQTGAPKNLTLMHASGQGNNKDKGHCHITYEGLIKRYICGHFANNQRMIELANAGKVEAYNFPQGVITQMYRAATAGKVGEITKIGLDTYIDPRLGGGKMSSSSTEDLVQLIDINGEEHLLYKSPKISIGIIRGTTADENGNISLEEELGPVDVLDIAMAAKNCGGKVIAQVKNVVKAGSIPAKDVAVPGIFVDAVVISAEPELYHRQTPGEFYNPVIAGHYQTGGVGFGTMPFDARKIIARRCYMELQHGAVINLGIGIPEGIAKVANEECRADDFVLTVESGQVGGIPGGGGNFGASFNAWGRLTMADQFAFYNGGGLSASFLGFAQVNAKGDINVTKFGSRLTGCGGFVDISQATKTVVFCGTFTAGDFACEVTGGNLCITAEGKRKKFLKDVEQVSFGADFAIKENMNILYVTERCVFRLTKDGLELIEVAPGIDPEKDIYPHMEFRPIVKDIKTMDKRIFNGSPMGI